MYRIGKFTLLSLLMAVSCPQIHAQSLKTAHRYAVLGDSTVTSTGATAITGDVGVSSPGISPTGFPPATLTGSIHAGDPGAAQANADVEQAYLALAGLTATVNLTGQDLGGRTLGPGIYLFSSSVGLTGDLILDAKGDPNAVFIFQIGSTLVTATNSSVKVINQPTRNNADGTVFWQVGSSATIGTGTRFAGNILAHTSITLVSHTSIACGRALAINGAVTMDTNDVSIACSSLLLGKWKVLSPTQGSGPIFNPSGIAADGSNNLFVSDTGDNRILKRDSQGIWTTLASYGSNLGQVNQPFGVAADGSGNLFVADTGNNWIQMRTSQGIWTALASYGSNLGQVNQPYGVVADGSGNLFITDAAGGGRIQKRNPQGIWTALASSGSNPGQMNIPQGVAGDGSGSLFIADTYNNRIQMHEVQGNWTVLATYGANLGQVNRASGVTVDKAGNLYVADTLNHRVQVEILVPIIALNDTATTLDGVVVTIPALANDADLNGYPLAVTSTTPGTHGKSQINSGGTVTYTPTSGYAGTDRFTYTVNDGQAPPATASVTVTMVSRSTFLNPSIDPKTGIATVNETRPFQWTTCSLAGGYYLYVGTTPGASDIIGFYTQNTSYPMKSLPGNRTLYARIFTYYNGHYYYKDASFALPNHPPAAKNQSISLAENSMRSIALSATDQDNNALKYSVVTGPSHGTLSGASPNLTYKPSTGFFGIDVFTFKANDGISNSNIATVSLTIIKGS